MADRVDDSELLIRYLRKSHISIDGSVLPTAYALRSYPPESGKDDEGYVSVFRFLYDGFDPVKDVPPLKNCTSFAVIEAAVCRGLSKSDLVVEVIAVPTRKAHAGITYALSGKILKGKAIPSQFIGIFLELANASIVFSLQ